MRGVGRCSARLRPDRYPIKAGRVHDAHYQTTTQGDVMTDQPGPQGPSRDRPPVWKRRRAWLVAGGSVLGVFVLLIIIGLIVGPQPTKTTTTATATPLATTTMTPVPTISPQPTAPTSSTTTQAPPMPTTTVFAPAPAPASAPPGQTVNQACAAQRWPQPVPNVVGLNLFDAGNGSLECFTIAQAIAPDGHDAMNDPARDAYRWRIISENPTAGTAVAADAPITLTLAQISP